MTIVIPNLHSFGYQLVERTSFKKGMNYFKGSIIGTQEEILCIEADAERQEKLIRIKNEIELKEDDELPRLEVIDFLEKENFSYLIYRVVRPNYNNSNFAQLLILSAIAALFLTSLTERLPSQYKALEEINQMIQVNFNENLTWFFLLIRYLISWAICLLSIFLVQVTRRDFYVDSEDKILVLIIPIFGILITLVLIFLPKLIIN